MCGLPTQVKHIHAALHGLRPTAQVVRHVSRSLYLRRVVVRHAIDWYSANRNRKGMAIELAIRDWAFLVRMWRLLALARLILPLPVIVKRFTAARLFFILGIASFSG